ncbi:exopolygalacturonate lyase [Klebsiella michiganensis]|nr:exopolygalacturonate lyase [Klebsiella michiganensis]
MVHELKNAYPYYDMMFAVDDKATARFIKAFLERSCLRLENAGNQPSRGVRQTDGRALAK